jgi:hypothetical protein
LNSDAVVKYMNCNKGPSHIEPVSNRLNLLQMLSESVGFKIMDETLQFILEQLKALRKRITDVAPT